MNKYINKNTTSKQNVNVNSQRHNNLTSNDIYIYIILYTLYYIHYITYHVIYILFSL